MKDTIADFYSRMKAYNDKRQENNRVYLQMIAAEENEKLRKEALNVYENAKAALNASVDAGIASSKAWGELNGAEVDDADMKLLQGGFSLTTDDLDGLIARHIKNGTMVRAVEDYADAHGIPLSWRPEVKSKVEAWEALRGSGLSLLASLFNACTADSADYSTRSAGGPMMDIAVQEWGIRFSSETVLSGILDE